MARSTAPVRQMSTSQTRVMADWLPATETQDVDTRDTTQSLRYFIRILGFVGEITNGIETCFELGNTHQSDGQNRSSCSVRL